jgi:hypothetical protein
LKRQSEQSAFSHSLAGRIQKRGGMWRAAAATATARRQLENTKFPTPLRPSLSLLSLRQARTLPHRDAPSAIRAESVEFNRKGCWDDSPEPALSPKIHKRQLLSGALKSCEGATNRCGVDFGAGRDKRRDGSRMPVRSGDVESPFALPLGAKDQSRPCSIPQRTQ